MFFPPVQTVERALSHIMDEETRVEVSETVEEAFRSKEEALQSKEQALQSKEQALQSKEEALQSKEQALQAKQCELLAVRELYAEKTRSTTAELARTKGLLHMRGLVGAVPMLAFRLSVCTLAERLSELPPTSRCRAKRVLCEASRRGGLCRNHKSDCSLDAGRRVP